MREVKADLVLPNLNLLKGTKVLCEVVSNGDYYVRLIIGPRDFSFNPETGERESAGLMKAKGAGA
jgi:hypothetical protein